MKNIRISILLTCSLILGSCGSLSDYINLAPTNLETITAVKEVLNSSAFKALSTLSKLSGDDPTSALPAEIQPVLATLSKLGLGGEIDKAKAQIGAASKLMYTEGQGIMTDAIKEVSFKDAAAIVIGGEDAATQVLKDAMYKSVKSRYSAKLDTELDKTEAKQYWPMATGAYNLFASDDKKVDNNLSDFMAERAVDALFLSMGKQEKAIRQDPASLGKSVVTKVFDYYQSKK